jgi:hypothetical protein
MRKTAPEGCNMAIIFTYLYAHKIQLITDVGANKQQKSAIVLTSGPIILIKYGNDDNGGNADCLLKS